MAISTAFNPTDRARGVGIKTNFTRLNPTDAELLPQKLAVIGPYDNEIAPGIEPTQFTNAKDVGDKYGYGSLLYYSALQLFPTSGDNIGTIPVTFYPVENAFGSTATQMHCLVSGGPASGAATLSIKFFNKESISFDVEVGDTDAVVAGKLLAAVQGTPTVPVRAVLDAVPEQVNFEFRWNGTAGQEFREMEIVGDAAATGQTFALAVDSSGTVSEDPNFYLGRMGEKWETMVLNCNCDASDSANLDLFESFGETRWNALVKKPLIVFTGYSVSSEATAIAYGDTRKSDRVNSLLYFQDLFAAKLEAANVEFAARMVSKIIRRANSQPSYDYGSLEILNSGDAQELNYASRDALLKAGISTYRYKNGSPVLADVVTLYHPDGDSNPAYRYVVDVVKLQNVIHNVNAIFDTPEWDGAPLIPNDQPTTNRDAKKPKAAEAAMAAMFDSLALLAIIADAPFAKENTAAEIDPGNPKRLNIETTFKLSGNTNIISIDLNWGFLFGTDTLA